MCYGDINHGTDGYYEQWAQSQDADREMIGDDVDYGLEDIGCK